MVSILMYVMKKDEKRQEKTESRYEKLVDKFIDTAREMSVKQEKTIKDVTTELKNITVELKTVSINVNACKNIIEDKLEAQHVSYIFKEENEEKRK
jgi:septal ring factor EnvC (AmiA/AmiB activator)